MSDIERLMRDMEAKINSLRATNAELLAALEKIIGHCEDGNLSRWEGDFERLIHEARAAIKRAKEAE